MAQFPNVKTLHFHRKEEFKGHSTVESIITPPKTLSRARENRILLYPTGALANNLREEPVTFMALGKQVKCSKSSREAERERERLVSFLGI